MQDVSGRPAADDWPGDLVTSAAHIRFTSGDTLTAVAAAFDATWAGTAAALRAHGTFADPDLGLGPAQAADIEERVLAWDAAEVADLLGLPLPRLSRLLGRRRTHELHGDAAILDGWVDDVLRRYAGRESMVRLGQAFGVTTAAVAALLRSHDVHLRDEDVPLDNGRLLAGCPMGTLTEQLDRLGPQARERIIFRGGDASAVRRSAAEFGVEVRAVQRVLSGHRPPELLRRVPEMSRRRRSA